MSKIVFITFFVLVSQSAYSKLIEYSFENDFYDFDSSLTHYGTMDVVFDLEQYELTSLSFSLNGEFWSTSSGLSSPVQKSYVDWGGLFEVFAIIERADVFNLLLPGVTGEFHFSEWKIYSEDPYDDVLLKLGEDSLAMMGYFQFGEKSFGVTSSLISREIISVTEPGSLHLLVTFLLLLIFSYKFKKAS